MIKNYFKTAWRNLVRGKGYSLINIGGLAVGMTVSMLIGLWIHDELSFNKHHKNYDSIAQLWAGGTDPESGAINGSDAMMLPIGSVLKTSYKRYFKHVMMAWWIGDYTLSIGDKKITNKGEFIGEDAPEMLSLNMLKGSYESLKDPHSIILSASAAEAIFGKDDPINQSLKIDNRIDVKVTGIYADLPRNNRFAEVQFFSPWSLWVSSNDWIRENVNEWDNRSFNVYVQLAPNVTMDEANAGIHDLFYRDAPKEYFKEIEKYKPYAQLFPMSKWHLYSEFKNGAPSGGRISFVWLFGTVGAFVLLLACINFVNLSTARSEKRAREVGVRKTLGSGKQRLVFQFLAESFLVVIISFTIAVFLLTFSIGWFNQLADKDISLRIASLSFWLIAVLFILVTATLAGLYPAFYLSSFQPVKVLKGTMRLGRFAAVPRKVLVVVQFSVSVVLIIGTIIVYQQIQHAQARPVGYSRNGLINISLNDPNYAGKHELIRTELLRTGVVANMAVSSNPITAVWNNSGGFNWTGADPAKDYDFATSNVGYDYGKTVGWQLLDGRDFSRQFASDSAGVILNETAVKYMGLENPIGELIKSEYHETPYRVIGVVKDLVMQSPYEPVKQTFFFLDYKYEAVSQASIRIDPNTSAGIALQKIETIFKKIVPSASFEYKFVDDEYAQKFSQEQRIGKLSALFAILAIFISCLGLFGLAAFVAEQRTKEIGIRKVIGASVIDLWKLLSTDFVLLVVISCVLAVPVAYYYMSGWLKQYQYHTEISWFVFALAIGGALLITLLTVSFQAIRVAIANPIKSLRTE